MAVFVLRKTKKIQFSMLLSLAKMLVIILLFGNVSCDTFCVLGSGNYSCPKANTECCSSGCCPRERHFYEIDRTVASTIAIAVICVCVFFALLFAVCCFWSRCPLFSACRVEFTHGEGDIPTYESKEDSIHLDTMPTEFSVKSTNKFSPVVVSNGNLPAEAM